MTIAAPDPFANRPLFGRDRESRAMIDLLARVGDDGRGRIVLLHGPAGIGKTALIRALQRNSAARDHRFAAGKCTRAQHQPPLFPFGAALARLIGEALVGAEVDLARLRMDLLVALRGDEAILGDLIPDLHQIIGEGWRRPDLPAGLVQPRICAALAAAIGVFAQAGRPLVLAIDDIQWADPLSLAFLASLARRTPAHLLLILAFRDPASDPTPPAPQFVELIQTLSPVAEDIAVQPIPAPAIADMMAARFGDVDPRIDWLAPTLGETTGGNPFLLLQQLRWLGEEGALAFDADRQVWTGRRSVIMDLVHREDGDDLLGTRLERLPAAQRRLLEVLALLSVPSPAWLLADILGTDPADLADALAVLAGAQFVRRAGDAVAMFHDRVLDAVVGGMSAPARAQAQMACAGAILRHLPALAPDWHFRAASLLQAAIFAGALPPAADRIACACHLLRSAQTNRQRGALDIAAGLVNALRAMAPPDWWEDQYPLMIAGDLLNLDILLASGLVDLAAERIDLLDQRVRTDDDRARALQFRARVQTVRSDYDGAIRAALAGLALLGIAVPRHPTQAACDALQRRLETLLARQPAADLVNLPLCEDPRALLASQLFAALLPALFDSPNIRYLHVALLVEFTLEHGICPASPYGLGWYGVMVAEDYGRYAEGMDLARAALAIVDRHGFEASRTETLVAVDQLSPWVEPIAACLGWVDAAIRAGQASGDLGMTCYARNHLISDLLQVGAPLDEVEREADAALHLTRQIAFTDIEQLIAAQRALVRLLRHGEAPLPVDPSIRSPATLYWVHLNRGVGAYLTDDAAGALMHFAALEPVEWAVPAHIDITLRSLFTALALARVVPADEAPARIAPHLAKLRRWAEVNPETFIPRLRLVEGELARLAGDNAAALAAFDAAAGLSGGLPHNQGLAHELAARLCSTQGLHETADLHGKAATEHYVRWGALAKAVRLEAPAYRPAHGADRPAILAMTSDEAMALARGWFEETDPERLRQRVLGQFMRLCRAGSASLFAIDDGGVRRVATAGTDNDGAWPIAIARLRKVTLAIAAPRHLTLPLIHKGVLIGAIGLRDHGIDQPLLTRPVQVLELLAAQAEIAISTAELHARLAAEAEKAAAVQTALRTARIEMARNSHWISLGEFTATLSHEINQPLSGIALQAAAARRWLHRDPPVIAEALDGLSAIASAAERAANIVRAVKTLTRQEPPAAGPVDINALVREVCAILENEIQLAGVAVRIDAAADDPCVIGDPVQLQQVIMNLFINALDALEANPAGDRTIALGVATADAQVRVRIEDNGPGIPDHLAARIFMPLVTSKQKGTGMGLAICKSIVAAHKGEIALVPTGGRGCGFVVRLPLHRAGDPQ